MALQFMIKKGMGIPLGTKKIEQGVQFSIASRGEQCKLNLYNKKNKEMVQQIVLTSEYKVGNIFSIIIQENEILNYYYKYEIDGKQQLDPYARKIIGTEKWGVLEEDLLCSIEDTYYNWQGERKFYIPYEEAIIYRLHIRGFTKHKSSKVKEKGTFFGLQEKIPYLKELGVNIVELMPIYEFSEFLPEQTVKGIPQHMKSHVNRVEKEQIELDSVLTEKTTRLNYWGYSNENYYFAPKTSYAKDIKNPSKEVKDLIAALHENEIEVILEFYFTKETNQNLILDCLRYWILEYHIDGFKINTEIIPSKLIATDPIVSKVKLFGTYWNENEIYGNITISTRTLAEYNTSFLVQARKFLKGDESQVDKIAYQIKKNPDKVATINYIANTNAFTLYDTWSYDQKHNEENGENNRDGSEINYSWNCGVEGKTRKKKIVELRKKQIKNSMALLLLSQGTPLLLSGDEFGQTQNGNNNPYCQDNERTWLNWNLLVTNKELYENIKKLIFLRKNHPILHQRKEFYGVDYLSYGMPDLSYHGTKAWYPDFSYCSRALGVMLCGNYAKKSEKEVDCYFYIAYNMHWEKHNFDLPSLPKNLIWEVEMQTDIGREIKIGETGIVEERNKLAEKGIKQYEVAARSVVVFISKLG